MMSASPIRWPSADASAPAGWVPCTTCGSCCGSPSSSRFFAHIDTASASARANWPASSMISRSKGSSRIAALANVHAVPPTRCPVSCSARHFTSAGLLFGCSHSAAGSGVRFARLAHGSSGALFIAALSTFSTALWLVEVTATVRPARTRRAISFPARNVLPAPGGPCTASAEPSRASTASITAAIRSAPGSGRAAPPRSRGGVRRSRSTPGCRGSTGSASTTRCARSATASSLGDGRTGLPGSTAVGRSAVVASGGQLSSSVSSTADAAATLASRVVPS